MLILCNIINAFTLTLDSFNTSINKTNIKSYWPQTFEWKMLQFCDYKKKNKTKKKQTNDRQWQIIK